MAYTKYSLTPANNNATPPDGAPEGMLPSAVNDTMRDMMAQIRDCGDGIRDGTYTMTAPKITGGTITGSTINNSAIGGTTANSGAFTTLSASGVATFSAGTVSAPALTTTGDTNTGIFFPAADTIAFTEGGVESMRIDSSGNVGIGTANPQQKLVISNSGAAGLEISPTAIASSPCFISYNRSSSAYTQLTSLALQHVWQNSGTEVMRIDSSGNVGIGTSSPSVALTVGDGTAPTNLTVLNALFSTNTASGANIVVRKSNDTAGVTSNLSFARSRGTAASPTAVSSGDNLGNLVSYGFDGTNYIIAAQITTAVDTTPGTNDMPGRIVFSTTADGAATVTERMRIDSSGNVGIGTSSPRFKLSFGSISAVSTATPDTVDLGGTFSSSAGANGKLRIWYDGGQYMGFGVSSNQLDYICTGGYSHVWYSNSAERMRIDSSGNVGINNTSPAVLASTTQVAIKANTSADAMFVAQNSNGLTTAKFGFQFTGSVDNPVIGSFTNHPFLFFTNNTERMRITSGGDLLVGATATVNSSKFYSVNSAGCAGVFYNSAASQQSIAALRVDKADNTNTTSQVFVQFTINSQATGSGQINANGASAAAFGTYSDERLKENIKGLPSQLANITSLRPVEFDYKDGSGHQIGFIAQEMKEVYPDVVGESNNGMLMITGWDKTSARLVKAIQEQQAMIEELKQEVALLKSK